MILFATGLLIGLAVAVIVVTLIVGSMRVETPKEEPPAAWRRPLFRRERIELPNGADPHLLVNLRTGREPTDRDRR